MKTLKIILKQHTPIIHFQHDQYGATLRATEVKPKLDRFILTKLGEGNYEEGNRIAKEKGWLIAKGDHPALDYKMRIESSNDHPDKYILASYISKKDMMKYDERKYNVIRQSPYFADDKLIRDNSPEEAKLGIMLGQNDHIEVKILSMNKDIINEIEKNTNLFFAQTNFGSRQNKGFGCFFPKDISEQVFIDCFEEENFPAIYYLPVRGEIDVVFREIDSIYKKLKSGDQNSESELRIYFNESFNIEWEKPVIQEKIAKISRKNIHIDKEDLEIMFVRSLLGLPELYEYPKHNKLKVRVKSKDKSIERYSSPILFKVFDNCIYIMANKNQLNNIIANKEFEFVFADENQEYTDEKITLAVPNVSFDVNDFLSQSLSNYKKWERIP